MGNKIYVGNLSFSATEESVRSAFEPYGAVSEVRIVTDRMTGRPRGFAFVTMGSAEEAARAIERMNGATVDGRTLRVNEAEDRPPRSGGGGGGGGYERRGGGGGGGYGGDRRGGGGGGYGGDRGGRR